jgi:hypothetical protein
MVVPAEKEDGILDEILSLFLGRIWMWLAVGLWEKGLVDCIGLRVSTNFYHEVNFIICPLV